MDTNLHRHFYFCSMLPARQERCSCSVPGLAASWGQDLEVGSRLLDEALSCSSVLVSTLLSAVCTEFPQGIKGKGVFGKAGGYGHSLGPGFDTNLIWSKSRGTI